jgi:hypothetical protein
MNVTMQQLAMTMLIVSTHLVHSVVPVILGMQEMDNILAMLPFQERTMDTTPRYLQ